MADPKPSVASLFGGIGSDVALKQATRAQDLALGKAMADVAPERVGLLYAPQAITAAGRTGRLLAGQDTRTQPEIEAAQNREIFSEISQKAQNMFPDNRTKQLNYLADELNRRGKVVEAQKARALAQESALTEAQIGTEKAKTYKATQEGVKAGGEASANVRDLGNFLGLDLKDASVESLAKAQKIRQAGKLEGEDELAYRNRILAALEAKPDKPSAFMEILNQRYPTDPAKRNTLMAEWLDAQAKTGGGAQQKEINQFVIEANQESINEYKALGKGGEYQAQQIDDAANVVFDSVVGGGSTLIAAMEGIARTAGIDLPGDFGSLTKRQQIERIINNEVLQAAGLIKGALSDKDLLFLQGSVGSLGDSPEAIRIALKRLAQKKRISAQMYKKYTGAQGLTKLASGLIDFEAEEAKIRKDLGLPDAKIFGAVFIDETGSVSPKFVDALIQGTMKKSQLGDYTPEAAKLLEDAMEAEMKRRGII